MALSKKLVIATLIGALGVSGCANMGEWGSKQTWGTVIGTVGGALLGSQIGGGSGRTIAIILGALAGGALGNWIGDNLDERDREALAVSTQQSLETGRTVNWESDHSGASAVIRPVSSKTVTQEAQVKRAPVIAKAENLTVLNQSYHALRSVNLRAAPDTKAEKVGGFQAGQTFTALGKTPNNWIAVGRKGVLVGYVHAPLAAPVTVAKADQATDLDSITVAQAGQQGFDLDTFEPASPVTETVAVQTTCRTMSYELTTEKGTESKTVDACQAVDGAWQIG